MIHKNKTAILAVVGATLVLVLGFAIFSNTNTSVAFDGPPGSAGVGSGAFAVNATGSVAIATTTFSASKLRVAGSIESTTGGFVFPDGSTQTTAASAGVTSTPAGYVTPGTFNSVAGTGGNYTFPASVVLDTTTSSSSGVIYKGAQAFLHNFAGAISDGYNTFLGLEAGNFNSILTFDPEDGSLNTGVGGYSLHNNGKGKGNAAVGWGSLTTNTTGNFNTAMGSGSLYANLSGDYNAANGVNSLLANTTGDYNTAMGGDALQRNEGGSNNTAVGYGTGWDGSLGLTSMTSSTFLGANANSSVDSITNSMALGAKAQVTKSNQVVIGNNSVTETLLRGNVGIGTTTAPTANLEVNTDNTSGNPVAFSLNDTSSQWYMSLARCASCFVGGAVSGDLVLRSANSNRFIVTADNGTTASLAVTATNRVGIGTQAPSSTLHVVNGVYTATVTVGSKLTGVNRGRMCLWNGASYTLVSFATNSIVPVYSTTTTC